jgi:radical SAM family RiPP maturation amino acid epimerase
MLILMPGVHPDIPSFAGADMSDAVLAVAPAHASSRACHLTAADAVAQVRRFMDVWTCDRSFREALLVDSRAAAAARGFALDPEDLRIFWDDGFRAAVEEAPPAEALRKVTPLGLIWIELRQRSKEYVTRVRNESVPDDPRFGAWRHSQIARCDVSFHPRFADSVPHIPFAIELSEGCSVGCWFCGVSAPKLDGHYRYSDENAGSFRTILKALARVAGRSAGKRGILYWATDPFDHPDYERFGLDFAKEFGAFPLTTTAQGWKDLSRIRNLIRLAAHGRSRVRLSILNLRMLDRYLSELAPSELAAVGFVPVNKESVAPITEAGRGRRTPPKSWSTFDASGTPETSICCMSGFLINVVRKSVRLISPCPSSGQWPNGYFVYDEKTYAHADEFSAVLEDMIERNMRSSSSLERPLQTA